MKRRTRHQRTRFGVEQDECILSNALNPETLARTEQRDTAGGDHQAKPQTVPTPSSLDFDETLRMYRLDTGSFPPKGSKRYAQILRFSFAMHYLGPKTRTLLEKAAAKST